MIKKMKEGAGINLGSFEERIKFLQKCKEEGLSLSMVSKDSMAEVYGNNTCFIWNCNKVTPIPVSLAETRGLTIVNKRVTHD